MLDVTPLLLLPPLPPSGPPSGPPPLCLPPPAGAAAGACPQEQRRQRQQQQQQNWLAITAHPPDHPGCVDRGGQGGDHLIARDVTSQVSREGGGDAASWACASWACASWGMHLGTMHLGAMHQPGDDHGAWQRAQPARAPRPQPGRAGPTSSQSGLHRPPFVPSLPRPHNPAPPPHTCNHPTPTPTPHSLWRDGTGCSRWPTATRGCGPHRTCA